AEQHADGIAAGIGRGQVETAVIVEIGGHHHLGVWADGEARGRAKTGRESLFQDFKARPVARGSARAPPPGVAFAPAPCDGGRGGARAERTYRSQVWSDMVGSPFRSWSATECGDIAPGAQTGRRGGAGPAGLAWR